MRVELTAPDTSSPAGAGRGEYQETTDERLAVVEAVVERELACSAHNLAHVRRVMALCRKLATDIPETDLKVLELASLLHDIARIREDGDDSGMTDHAAVGAEMAGEILRSAGYPEQTVRHVCSCIATHRFRGTTTPESIEAKILFDADKLDSLGAVGIARAYMLAARYGEGLYSDEDPYAYVARNHVGGTPTGRIKTLSAHTPNLEFEIAFKRIPDRLFTAQARALAAGRLAVMQSFFERLAQELGSIS